MCLTPAWHPVDVQYLMTIVIQTSEPGQESPLQHP